MTDNENIKGVCKRKLCEPALEIINRQKAEIEELKKEIGIGTIYKDILIHTKTLDDYNAFKNAVKSEAIREFAERLKERRGRNFPFTEAVSIFDINSLVKEMTEGGNGMSEERTV